MPIVVVAREKETESDQCATEKNVHKIAEIMFEHDSVPQIDK